jgi:ATP-dependent Clp protease ATP-binding subunit ClpA
MFFKKQFNFATKAFTFILLGSFILSNVSMMHIFAGNKSGNSVKASALGKYATDLTALVRAGRLGENAGYEREVNQLIKALEYEIQVLS